MKKSSGIRALATGAAALIALLGLAACSTPTGPDEDSGANMADVMFVQMMIPHHEGAIEMSDLLLSKSGIDPEVVELAEQIKAAQGPEIEQLQTWLAEWDVDPDAQPDDHSAHMDGMLSADDIAELEAASGAAASVLFLEQMIAHHEGAVAMAETEVSGGENLDAVRLAERIIETQGVEIETMRGILASL